VNTAEIRDMPAVFSISSFSLNLCPDFSEKYRLKGFLFRIREMERRLHGRKDWQSDCLLQGEVQKQTDGKAP